MNSKVILNEKWLKASIIGTVWASSEIVLGSFLHNLKVPFSGSILTAIGIVLLISSSYVWIDKGIFWRSGMICALMKTMSPSAVIFGPMIAIFTEGVLLEISVRAFGRNYIGFIIGAILASSWTFAQKILNFLIFYGFNIVELYKSLMLFTQKQLNLNFNTLWVPILLLLAVYVLAGIVAAVLGIRTGKSLASHPVKYTPAHYQNQMQPQDFAQRLPFNYSILWLIFDLVCILVSLLLLSLTSWYIWGVAISLIVMVWVMKYKRALKQLMRPKFWIFFGVITMLTALVFTQFQGKALIDAILIGVEMNFRASVLILGFSVLGTELYNPIIRQFFHNTRFKQLPLALELSAQSLPMVISNIPDMKSILKNPIASVSQLIAYSDYRFSQLKQEQNFLPKVFIVSGEIDSGKTFFVKKLVATFRLKQMQVEGIYSEKIIENGERIGYNLVDIRTKTSEIFLRKTFDDAPERIGMFGIYPQAIQMGNQILNHKNLVTKTLVAIDEVGKLELMGKGWSESLASILKNNQHHVLLTVRSEMVQKVLERFHVSRYEIVNLKQTSVEDGIEKILASIGQRY